jgi:hypothetical protein
VAVVAALEKNAWLPPTPMSAITFWAAEPKEKAHPRACSPAKFKPSVSKSSSNKTCTAGNGSSTKFNVLAPALISKSSSLSGKKPSFHAVML